MKYKDLLIGDWFEVDGHKYIKCDYDGKHTVGVILDNETIGTVRAFFDDEIDLIFLTELHNYSPKQNIDTETIIKNAPWKKKKKNPNADVYFVKLAHRTGNGADLVLISTNRMQGADADSCIIANKPVKVIAKADLYYKEKTWQIILLMLYYNQVVKLWNIKTF